MKYGLTETTIAKIHAVFARFPEIEKAVLYGSRAKGNFKTGSDIDLTLYGEALTSDLRSAIASALDDQLLPNTIDLSLYDELDHAKLREHIERVGVLFYERVHQEAVMKNGWKQKLVGEILQLEYDKPLDEADRKPNGRYPVYGANGEKDRTDKFYHDKPSIIVGRKGSAGEINLTEKKFWPLDVTYFVTFDESQHDLRFLYYLLTTLELTKLAKGVKPGINRNEVYTQVTRVPPLPEQQRIVGILDEAFDGIATAKANAEQNLQNSRALFESHLQSVFEKPGKDWVKKRLGDLARINYGYTESASAEKVGPKFLRITDIQDNRVDWSSVPYCPIDASDLPKYKLADGDIVFARTGATTGKSYLVTDPPKAVFASYLIRVQLSEKELLPTFVNLFFQTHTYWDSIRAGVSGSAQGGFNATKLGELVIPFPKLQKEQHAIVAKLESLSKETQRLESIYRQKLAALEELKQALLHRAFNGEL